LVLFKYIIIDLIAKRLAHKRRLWRSFVAEMEVFYDLVVVVLVDVVFTANGNVNDPSPIILNAN
jgi:hypothetical protein